MDGILNEESYGYRVSWRRMESNVFCTDWSMDAISLALIGVVFPVVVWDDIVNGASLKS